MELKFNDTNLSRDEYYGLVELLENIAHGAELTHQYRTGVTTNYNHFVNNGLRLQGLLEDNNLSLDYDLPRADILGVFYIPVTIKDINGNAVAVFNLEAR